MDEDLKQIVRDHLIRSRHESLAELQQQNAMSTLGKVRSMDVFSWKNPGADALSRAVVNFQAPVIWLCTANECKSFFRHDPKIVSAFRQVIIYDDPTFECLPEWHTVPFDILAVEGIDCAVRAVVAECQHHRIVLLTGENEGWNQTLQQFKDQLNTI